MAAKTKPRRDIYQDITNKIVAQLEDGIRPWLKPWNAEHAAGRITRPLRHNGEDYHGINILVLWDSALQQGFNCPLWLTYRQALELGGHVRKGEKSTPVVYASSFRKTSVLVLADWVRFNPKRAQCRLSMISPPTPPMRRNILRQWSKRAPIAVMR